MNESVVRVFDDNLTSITKAGYTALVQKSGTIIVVTSNKLGPFGRPHCALVKYFGDDIEETLKTYHKIVYKLIRKGIDSKYFGDPKYHEHLMNGELNGLNPDLAENLCQDAFNTFNKAFC